MAEKRKRGPRRLETWWYMSDPVLYNAAGEATVTFPRIDQTTWNGVVGMFALASNPMATFRNLITSFRVVQNETIIGDGCPLGLIAGETRVTAQDFLTAPVAPFGLNPTFHGFPYWPGETFELKGGLQVGAVPFPATGTARIQLTNVGVPVDDDIDFIGLIMVEIPEDLEAPNYADLLDTWELLKRGFGGISFGTHTLPSPALGGTAEDELVLQTWHENNLRRSDLRGVTLVSDGVARFADESLFRRSTFNTRSDRSRLVGEGNAPASLLTGYAGLPNSPLFTLDFRGVGSDRETIQVVTPVNPAGLDGEIHFCSILSGIGEMQYFGRQAGEAF